MIGFHEKKYNIHCKDNRGYVETAEIRYELMITPFIAVETDQCINKSWSCTKIPL